MLSLSAVVLKYTLAALLIPTAFGIDAKAVSRAVFKTVLLGDKSAGGGSTITQQLAKQLYTPPSSGMLGRAMQKPIEWMIAIKLERFYSKEEIIKMYLNQFDFLYNAVGIKSAAKVYFNTIDGGVYAQSVVVDVILAAVGFRVFVNPSVERVDGPCYAVIGEQCARANGGAWQK